MTSISTTKMTSATRWWRFCPKARISTYGPAWKTSTKTKSTNWSKVSTRIPIAPRLFSAHETKRFDTFVGDVADAVRDVTISNARELKDIFDAEPARAGLMTGRP